MSEDNGIGRKLNLGNLSKSPLLRKVKQKKLPQTEQEKPDKPANALKHALNKLQQKDFPNADEPKPKAQTNQNANRVSNSVDDLDISDFDSIDNSPMHESTSVQNYHYAEQADAVDNTVLQTFYEQMHRIANSFDDPQLPYMLKEIREYLNEHEECQEVIAPEDIGLLVKALRASYKQTAAKKTAGNQKRAKANAKVDEIASALDGIF